MNNPKKSRLEQIADLPFLAVLTVYLTHLFFQSSTFYLPTPDKFLIKLFLLFGLSLLPRIPVYLKALKTQKKILAAAFLLALNYALVYHFGDHLFLLFSGLLTIAFLGMDHQKVLKLFTIILGCFLILTFSAACCGAIQDFVMMKNGYVRTALGICYPTDMASYVLFLLMYSWAAWRRIPDPIAFILGIVCFFFSRYIAMSITCTICSAVFCFVVLGHFLCIECELAKKVPVFLKTLTLQLIIFACPLLALLMFVLIFAYSRNIGPAIRLNSLLSKRLALPLDAYLLYGLQPFGTPFDQNGNGFTTFASNNYNFVDSTYPLILLRYGWILFLAICTSWTVTTRNAFRNKDTRLACLMAMIAFHSFSEHHFIETNFNILVLMPFAAFQPVPSAQKCSVSESVRRSALIFLALTAATGLAAWILPVFFTWMRTVFQINQWTEGGEKGFQVLYTLINIYGSVILTAAGVIFCIYILTFGKSKAPKRKAAAAVIISAVSLWNLYSVVQSGTALISKSVSKYSQQLEEDQTAIQLITGSASGKVYVDSFPCMYQKEVEGISNSLLLGDELARFYNTSVITDVKHDSNCFINSGFLFTPISRRYGLYTNDSNVISAMKDHGYHLTGYYNVKKTINLKSLARINQLTYTEEAGLSLSGNDQALKRGPYISLYSGPYTVDYTLHLSIDSSAGETTPDSDVATLRISAYNGEKILKEHVLKREFFDADGNAVIQIPFTSESYSGIEFLAFPENDQDFNITSICYYRSPQYDIHMFYNKQRQKYREEYYNLEGSSVETSTGYSACEYEYDYNGKITEIRYYDTQNQPALLSSGYSSLRRKLDQKGRTILESYFGTDGEPTLCSARYASVSREYDDDNNIIVQKFFDIEGDPVATTSLYAEIHRVFNNKHQVIQESYFDTDGQPFTLPSGYAMTEFQYDSSGRPYIQKFLDANKNPVIIDKHYAEIHREYTPQNWISKESYYDTTGNPLALPDGYAMVKRSFDERGNALLTEYCDFEGRRVITKMHYAALKCRYNDRNHITYESYYGISNEPIVMPENYSSVSYERNIYGDAINYKYYDQNGNTAIRTEGYSEMKREYNESRLPVRDIFIDANGKPVITTMQYAEIRREFNALRQISRVYYYGTNGEPVQLADGYSSVAYVNDDYGNHIQIKYYDLNGLPTTTIRGYAEIHRTYNQKRQITSECYFDNQGLPTLNSPGFHYVEYEYDHNGQIVKASYFNKSMEPIEIR